MLKYAGEPLCDGFFEAREQRRRVAGEIGE